VYTDDGWLWRCLPDNGNSAIPTGIITAGFNKEIRNEKENEDGKDSIEMMPDEELLVLQGKVNRQLSKRGYVTIVSCQQNGSSGDGDK